MTADLGFFVVVLANEMPMQSFTGVCVFALAEDNGCVDCLLIQRLRNARLISLSVSPDVRCRLTCKPALVCFCRQALQEGRHCVFASCHQGASPLRGTSVLLCIHCFFR